MTSKQGVRERAPHAEAALLRLRRPACKNDSQCCGAYRDRGCRRLLAQQRGGDRVDPTRTGAKDHETGSVSV
ncbi:hypothetical protein [Dictyobacter vulcani]|uniref:hypothetical protein n=1 Tax=Dictyobacter vulcani TaxID=2607529 RepID=UPI001386A317|nr:hypothetical protein [Dictyobacter vulcani]